MLKLIQVCWEWMSGWLKPRYRLVHVADEPDSLKRRTVYVIGEDGAEWAIVFVCPCGCEEKVWLNLLPSEQRPCWRYECHANGSPTVEPSVWRKGGCRSHFFLRRGRLIWCREN